MHKKILKGIISSDKMDKCVVVSVLEVKKLKKYHKSYTFNKKYIVKDEKNTAKKGDSVTIVETKPFSKKGKWLLVDNKLETKNKKDKLNIKKNKK